MSGCSLDSAIPSPWGLAGLEYLDLHNSSLTGSFDGLATASLWYLDVSDNQLTGSVTAVTNAPNMSFAMLSNNSGIVGSITTGKEYTTIGGRGGKEDLHGQAHNMSGFAQQQRAECLLQSGSRPCVSIHCKCSNIFIRGMLMRQVQRLSVVWVLCILRLQSA